MLETIRDFRFGVRVLRRSPAFTAVAVTTLALGIGATTAIFSFVDAALLKPLDYPHPEQLVTVWEVSRYGRNMPAPALFTAWREQNRVFSHLSAYAQYMGDESIDGNMSLSIPYGAAERVQCAAVSANYFDLLGIGAVLGRTFRPGEDQPGNEFVVVLSNRLWRRSFAADPGITGKTAFLNGKPYTIVGVLPPGVTDRSAIAAWLPLALKPADIRPWSNIFMSWARLKPGLSIEQAQDEMNRLTEGIRQQHLSWWPEEIRVELEPLRQNFVDSGLRQALLMLFGGVGFLLLIACANVANLMLARAGARRQEAAVRLSLGAGRFQLMRQFLAESALLSLAGGALGLLLAVWLLDGAQALLPETALPRDIAVTVDHRVLLFSLGLSFASALLFGTAPAWQLSGAHPQNQRLSAALRRGRANRTGRLLLVFEIALTCILLAGSGLLMRSFVRLINVDPGIRTEGVLTFRTELSKSRFPQPHQITGYQAALLQRIQAVPGVTAAGSTNSLPLAGSSLNTDAKIVGHRGRANTGVRVVTPDYLPAMGIRLLKGRMLSKLDSAQAPPVAVVNEALVKRLLPGQDPIGERIRFLGYEGFEHTIVGIVADVKHQGLDLHVNPEAYLPLDQLTAEPLSSYGRRMTVVVRTSTDPRRLIPVIQEIAKALDKDQPLFDIKTMEQVVSDSVARPRFRTLLLGGFAALALLLAGVGIYGLLYYLVSQRTREIGLRMALGAQVRDVFAMVLRQGMALVLAGLVLGTAGALALTRVLQSFLFGITPHDAMTFAAVVALIAATAFAACYFPARRAARVAPMDALRYE
ncbi:MAG: ABC transporter permease [Acidobacteria bacterium]|nr:ABC transporter permease [Acidobacteriota bacterium]